jgi:hypothetical protein
MQPYNSNRRKTSLPKSNHVVKLKELALYYNLAVDRLILFLNYYAGSSRTETYWKKQFAECRKLYEEGKTGTAENIIPAGVFAYLKVFLFNTASSDRTEVIAINNQERYFLILFAEKLFALRNWHSHYCHNNSELYFKINNNGQNCLNELGEFFEERLTNAAETKIGTDEDLRRYFKMELKKSFTLFDSEYKITQEGRLFFLQFFITKSEMEQCLSAVKGFKKTEGAEWKLKRQLFSFYSKRDGSSLLAVLYKAAEKEAGPDDKAVKQQMNLFNKFNEAAEYLKKKPALMCFAPEIETWRRRNELEKEEADALPPLRLKNSFTHFAIQYLLDFESELKLRNKIFWRMRDFTEEAVEKQKDIDTGYKKYAKHFTVIKKKPVYSSREFLGERVYSKNNTFYFKLFIDGKKILCCVNEQSMLYWMGALLIEHEAPEKILQRMEAYVKQYRIIIEKLAKNESVNLQQYQNIRPEFLHTKLKDWIKKQPDGEKEGKYKTDIKNKIASAISYIGSLTVEELAKMRNNDKNELLFKWYNYLLPVESKLSQAKKEVGFYSEVANLSRFHYVPSSSNGEIRRRLLAGVKEKLPDSLCNILTERPYKNIDDIVLAVAPFMKEWLLYLSDIVTKEMHPPEWDNTQKTASELSAIPLSSWSKMSIDNWHLLARKFKVPNPFIDKSRMKDVGRADQLKEFFTSSPVQLPKYVFINAENHEPNVDSAGKKNFSYAKLIREDARAGALMPDFYTTDGNDTFLKKKAAEAGYSQIGTLLKEILYQKSTDTLVWVICLEYHKKLFASGKITSTSKINYETVTAATINNHEFEWEIAGRKIKIGQSQLRQLMYDYKISEIETIVSKNLNTDDTIDSVKKAFKDNYYQSLRFIQRIFELEECVLNNECASLLSGAQKYVDFNEIMNRMDSIVWDEEIKKKITKLRNEALHTKIPADIPYDDGISLIEGYLTAHNFQFRPYEVFADENKK